MQSPSSGLKLSPAENNEILHLSKKIEYIMKRNFDKWFEKESKKIAQEIMEMVTKEKCDCYHTKNLVTNKATQTQQLESKFTSKKGKGEIKKKKRSKSKPIKTRETNKHGQNSENESPTQSESSEVDLSLAKKVERKVFADVNHSGNIFDLHHQNESEVNERRNRIRMKKSNCESNKESWKIIESDHKNCYAQNPSPYSSQLSSPYSELINSQSDEGGVDQFENMGKSETVSTNNENADDDDVISIGKEFVCKVENSEIFLTGQVDVENPESECLNNGSNSADIFDEIQNAENPATPQVDAENARDDNYVDNQNLSNAEEEEEVDWVNNEIVIPDTPIVSLINSGLLDLEEPCWKTPPGKQRAQFHKRRAQSLETMLSEKNSCKKDNVGTEARRGLSFDYANLSAKPHDVDVSKSDLGFYCLCRESSFASKNSLQVHIKRFSHTNEGKPFSCQLCSKKYKHRTTLDNHIRSQHLKGVTKPIAKKPKMGRTSMTIPINRKIWCGECAIQFETKQQLCDHYGKTHYGKKSIATKPVKSDHFTASAAATNQGDVACSENDLLINGENAGGDESYKLIFTFEQLHSHTEINQ